MTEPSEHDNDKRDFEREEHLDAETIAEDAEELFSKDTPDGAGAELQPDAPPPED